MGKDVSGNTTLSTVVALQGKPIKNKTPNNNDYLAYTDGYWQPLSATFYSTPTGSPNGGDLDPASTYPKPTVLKINQRQIPKASSASIGNVLQASDGAIPVVYGPINISDGSPKNNYTKNKLPLSKMDSQKMGGDVDGYTTTNTSSPKQTKVIRLRGVSVAAPTAPLSSYDGYFLFYKGTSSPNQWELRPPTVGAIPTGPASGDLDGYYPDPTVAKINGSAIPKSPQPNTFIQVDVSASNKLKYASIDLSGANGFINKLPAIKLAPQGLGSDLSGTVSNSKVTGVLGAKIVGAPSLPNKFLLSQVSSTLNYASPNLSLSDGYVNLSGLSAQPFATPASGSASIYFDSTLKKFRAYEGASGAWKDLITTTVKQLITPQATQTASDVFDISLPNISLTTYGYDPFDVKAKLKFIPSYAGSPHTATPLKNGYLLVVYSNVGLIIDSVSGNVVSKLTRNKNTYYHKAVALSNGNVLIVGGLEFSGTTYLPSTCVEIYNSNTGSFELFKNQLTVGVYGHTLTHVDESSGVKGLVVIMGGTNSTASTVLPTGNITSITSIHPSVNNCYVFDYIYPNAIALKATTALPATLCYHTANALPNSDIFVVGFSKSWLCRINGDRSISFVALTVPTGMTLPQVGHSSVNYNDASGNAKVLIVGGSSQYLYCGPFDSTKSIAPLPLLPFGTINPTANIINKVFSYAASSIAGTPGSFNALSVPLPINTPTSYLDQNLMYVNMSSVKLPGGKIFFTGSSLYITTTNAPTYGAVVRFIFDNKTETIDTSAAGIVSLNFTASTGKTYLSQANFITLLCGHTMNTSPNGNVFVIGGIANIMQSQTGPSVFLGANPLQFYYADSSSKISGTCDLSSTSVISKPDIVSFGYSGSVNSTNYFDLKVTLPPSISVENGKTITICASPFYSACNYSISTAVTSTDDLFYLGNNNKPSVTFVLDKNNVLPGSKPRWIAVDNSG